ncbi:hypothetical protein V6246_10280 [Algibacter sp. TI.3.09]|uniref:hypothetical protein n=1 Tax=Algibacter sp. TI.3.09 TaxID=3121298 RepID=UPI00311E8DA6
MEDKLYHLLTLYKNLPFPIKFIVGKIYNSLPTNIKYGRFYNLYLKRINDFNKRQNVLLENQISYVIENIPYYKGNEYKSIIDFPVINKNIIRENFNQFLNLKNNGIKTNTGGSSGTPFEFYLEKGVSRPKEKAHFDWYWNQFGYNSGNKILMIRGESLANDKLYEYQAIGNKLAISCYHINKINIESVINIINKFNPKFIHGYPSALKNFIDLVEENSKSLELEIKAIFLGSEGLFYKDKERIKKYFNSKIAHWYGHSERLVHAGNCMYSDDFHIFPFYGYVELLDDENNVITEPNIKGKIVATGFDNTVMPFIRYDTGDEAEYSEMNKCNCGFIGNSFKKIHGRNQDYIYLIDRTKVSLTAFVFGQHFDEFSKINQIQLEQNEYGKLIIRIVLRGETINNKGFVKKLTDSVNAQLEIELKIVENIKKTKRGKHIFLIQNLKKT